MERNSSDNTLDLFLPRGRAKNVNNWFNWEAHVHGIDSFAEMRKCRMRCLYRATIGAGYH